jgi:signal peptidase I
VSEVRLIGNPSVHDGGDPVKAGRGDRLARNLLLPLVIVLLAVIAVFYVFFDVSQVAGPSMVPTLLDGDRLLLTKGYTAPRHGDIVVFVIDEQGTPTEIVKRVVGLPGDTIEVFGDTVAVNGKPEATPHTGIVKLDQPHIAPQVVPAGSVFVMGDNRPVSLDSRYIGPLPLTTAHGRVAAIWAPIGRMRVVPSGLD